MLFISKAQEISNLNDQFTKGVVGQKDYSERMSAILYSAYRFSESGVTLEQEKQLLWKLAVDDVINQRDYDEQISKLYQARNVSSNRPHRQQMAPPPLMRKKGYVAPIVWLIIGWCFCHWFLPLGIIILILALIGLSCRVSHNKNAEVQNAEMMMRYGAGNPYA